MRNALLTIAMLTISVAVPAQEHVHDQTPPPQTTTMAAPAPAPTPPARQPWAQQALEASPRHREWVNVKSGDRTISAFVVYPEVKKKATSVVVIHEIFGMSDWVQMLADELAEAGYIAIAPDLLSGMGPNGGGTSAFTDGQAIGKAIRDLPPDQIASDLNAVADYVSRLPAANGKVAAAGFCWGGGQTFRFATNRAKLAAAFVLGGCALCNQLSRVRRVSVQLKNRSLSMS